MEFTEEQLAVFESNRKHTIVESGPGSGKTSTVVGVIRHRMKKGLKPQEIVTFTFTRRAGKELTDRLGKDARGMWIGTFHSVALEIIQKYSPDIRVIPEEESIYLIREAGRRVNLFDGTKWKYKSESKWLEDLEQARLNHHFGRETNLKLRAAYESLLKSGGDIDYLGCLLRACEILNDNPGCMGDIKLVIVDEAQDTDELQWSMVDLIMGEKADGIYVGDLRQNLYNWRRARPDIFESRPRALRLRLSRSFRCTKPVMDAANNLIGNNPEGVLPIQSDKDGDPVMLSEWDATNATKFFMDLFYAPRDIAILCRTNREVRAIQEALSIDDIPVYYEPLETDHRAVYATLLLTAKPTSTSASSMFREINKNFLGLPDVEPLRLSVSKDPVAREFGKSMCLGESAFVHEVLSPLAGSLPKDSMDWWIKEYGGHRVIDAIRDYSMREEGSSVVDGVVVETIHQSKGLEYPVVIIPNVIDGQFPSKRCMESEKSMEDERRVMFVAMTRSVERLAILTSFTHPSQFIKEAGLNVNQGSNGRRGVPALNATSFSGGDDETPF